MELKGVVWLGTRTARFDEMSAFTRDVLGLELKHGEDGLAVFELPDGDTFEIFDTHHPGGGHPDGVAAGFLVDDAEAAATELRCRCRGDRGRQRRRVPLGLLPRARREPL